MLLVDRQALSEHTTTSSSTKSLGQALSVSLVKPGAYLSESYFGMINRQAHAPILETGMFPQRHVFFSVILETGMIDFPVKGDGAISSAEQGLPILLEMGMIPPGNGDDCLLTGREMTV